MRTDEEIDKDPQWHAIQLKAKKESDLHAEIRMVLEIHGGTVEDLRDMVEAHDYYHSDEFKEAYGDGSSAHCIDCGVHTVQIGEYYNVHDRIWEESGGEDGLLCIGCLENRLGRMLVPDDFGYCLINWDPLYFRSARFFDRLGWGQYLDTDEKSMVD